MRDEFRNNSLFYKDDYYEVLFPSQELTHWHISLPDEFNVESGVYMSQSVFEGIVRELKK